MHELTFCFTSTSLGPIGKSVFTFWNSIHNVGAGFRWCAISCTVENPTSCNDGIAKSSSFFRRLFVFNYEARTLTFYKEGLVCS